MAISIRPLQPGLTVQVLCPMYAAGEVGVILAPESGSDRWLVQVTDQDHILSLAPDEFEFIASVNAGKAP